MRIKPFRGLMPDEKVAAPRYTPDTFCEQAKDLYPDYVAEELMRQDAAPAYYVLAIDTTHRHLGLVALTDVHDLLDGHIKKHEKTLAAREAQYFDLLQEWRAVIKPVLLAYADRERRMTAWITEFANNRAPVMSMFFDKTQETHTLWAITEPEDQAAVAQLMSEVSSVYIADGHHRTTTIARMYQDDGAGSGLDFSHIYSAYFAADQLSILGYHRVVGVAVEQDHLLEQLKTHFEVAVVADDVAPTQTHEILMLRSGQQALMLRWKGTDPHALDAQLLNELILQPVLGIEDARTDKRIKYVEGTKGVQGVRAALTDDSVGFVLHPIAFDTMAAISDQGGTLPPKSTWFEPRLKSGLIVQSLEVGA
jgi:uncharacterized protein (DUF1015 family)